MAITSGFHLLDVSAFVITALSGETREIVLSGRALPFRPYSLKGSQRAEFTWTPGSPVASVQVMGSQEAPTTIKGRWSDRFIGDNTTVTAQGAEIISNAPPATLNGEALSNVKELVRAVEQIRRAGQLVRVTWEETVRHGILTDFSQMWSTARDVEWEMTFTWASLGDEAAITFVAEEMDLSELVARHRLLSDAALGAIGGVADVLAITESKTFTDEVTTKLANARTSVSNMEDTVNGLVGQVTNPLGALAAAAGMCGFIRQEMTDLEFNLQDSIHASLLIFGVDFQLQTMASTFKQWFTAKAPSQTASISNTVRSQTAPFAAQVSVQKKVRDLRRAVRGHKHQATNDQIRLSKRLDGDLLGTHTGRLGEDLRGVSQAFYQSPDEWQRLARFNGVTTSKVQAGQVILVPRADDGKRGRAR